MRSRVKIFLIFLSNFTPAGTLYIVRSMLGMRQKGATMRQKKEQKTRPGRFSLNSSLLSLDYLCKTNPNSLIFSPKSRIAEKNKPNLIGSRPVILNGVKDSKMCKTNPKYPFFSRKSKVVNRKYVKQTQNTPESV